MIQFAKADIGWREIWEVIKVLRSGWLTTGKVTKKFEEEFADYVGAKYAVATSSCTIALELALRCNGIEKGDVVICPSFTFAATPQAIENCGGTVLFGDISPDTLCLDKDSEIVKLGLKHAKMVLPVHLGGNEAKTTWNDKIVIEDSAHRIERDQCKDSNNLVCFSFYPTKNMTTGEGGMIATNSKEDYEWLKKAISHGRSKIIGHGYEVEFTGLKANLPDILSAIGLIQIRKLERMTEKRDKIVGWYNKYLGRGIWSGNHLYPVFVKEPDRFVQYMKDNGVQCSRHFSPLHKMKGFERHNKFKLPITERLGESEVSLPLYPGLKEKEIKYISNLVNQYV